MSHHQKALMVSQELIRVAILWLEMWHVGLEEASRLYFNNNNSQGMLIILEELHEIMERVIILRNYFISY
jgi:FKBP12-rapamycin complex-associated protein